MDKFQFEHIELLWLLALIPVMILLHYFYRYHSEKKLKKIGDLELLKELVPDRSEVKPTIRLSIHALAFTFLILAIAKPQLGSKLETIERKGIDLVVAIDVSKSMLAEDVAPSRLEKTKLFVSKLIDNLKGDRLGLIVYAGRPYAQMALTTDYAAAKMFLSTVNTNIVPTQGTDIAGAVEMAGRYLKNSETKNQVLYIISDGENHEKGALESVAKINKDGVNVHTLGVGTLQGGPIPTRSGNNDFKKDRDGKIVVSKMDGARLTEIAKQGGGSFAHLVNIQGAIDFFLNEIDDLEKTKFDSKRFSDYEDQYQWFLAIALILLFLDILMPDTKSQWLRKWNIFDV